MVSDAVLQCPHCGTSIPLTESLAAPLLEAERHRSASELARLRAELDQRLAQSRAEVAAQEQRKARELAHAEIAHSATELAEVRQRLADRDAKLATAQADQAEALRRQRLFDDKLRELDLTIEQRVAEKLSAERLLARNAAEQELKLKVADREQTIVAMQQQLEVLQRKLEQGSQQHQGEVQELQIEALLRRRFPIDQIEPVPKGERGGDALHRIVGPGGQDCGTILWESKRTLRWSDAWIDKLKQNQREARAELAVIVSQSLPAGIEHFDYVEGVWVVSPRLATAVATSLRLSLIELTTARKAIIGQHGKMELVYSYLTGPHFRQRVQAIADAFNGMQDDLLRERKLFIKHWARREAQIDRVLQSTLGLYGDLQGIAGRGELFELDGFELPALEDEDDP